MLHAVYPHYNLTNPTISSYCLLLQDIPTEVLKAAAIQCARTGTFFPSVAELVKASYEFSQGDTTTAEEAWGLVIRQMSRPMRRYYDGKTQVLKPLADRIERAVEAVGGWRMLRLSENSVADRARFIQAYQAIAERQQREATRHPQVTAMQNKLLGKRKELGDGHSKGD
jgi:hypothetical protein